MMRHDFAGFGFGPIQAGLFAVEARRSGRFTDIVISEVDAGLVEAARRNNDRYAVNVAGPDGIETLEIEGVRLLNPRDASDRPVLEAQLAVATEIVTSLPSVNIFTVGGADSVAALLARAMRNENAPPAVVYTAENNNHAAEILEHDARAAGWGNPCRTMQFLNTVIGKMSQVVTDANEIQSRGLVPIAPGYPRAFLVEAFNHILVSKTRIPGFRPGIDVFEEKDDLLPFEEAKLFGHNAIHTLLGFLGRERGCTGMAQLRDLPDIMQQARTAFIDEAGAALIRRHTALRDRLFSAEGFREYADDLLRRMTNPWLDDAVARIVRDPLRKLGYADRVFGAIRLCLAQGIEPRNLAAGARAGVRCLLRDRQLDPPPLPADAAGRDLDGAEWAVLLQRLWGADFHPDEAERIIRLLRQDSP